MSTVIAIGNQRGGVGKTSLTLNLGATFANANEQTLVIDTDPQGHLTRSLGLTDYFNDTTSKFTLYEALLQTRLAPRVNELIFKHPTEPFWILPAHIRLGLAEKQLYPEANREHRLRQLLNYVSTPFQWILIDTPPSIGNITDNVLNAARKLLVPIIPDASAAGSLEMVLNQVGSLEGLNIQIQILGIVPNQVQDSSLSKRVINELRGQVDIITPFEIKKRVLYQKAWDKNRSVITYETDSNADEQVKQEVKETYEKLAAYVREQVKGANA